MHIPNKTYIYKYVILLPLNVVFSIYMFCMSFRYIAICHPLKTSWHAGKRQTTCIIISIWIFSIIFGLVWMPFATVSTSAYIGNRMSI